ncbi:hypothetical protein HY839_01140 [Candidatus Azambacteria bacterium]|nr:hypothetical protein [Candidatus Azambacteria bacterium]
MARKKSWRDYTVMQLIRKTALKKWTKKRGEENTWKLTLPRTRNWGKNYITLKDANPFIELSFAIEGASCWEKISEEKPNFAELRTIVNKIIEYRAKT